MSYVVTEAFVPLFQWTASDLTNISLNTFSQKTKRKNILLYKTMYLGSDLRFFLNVKPGHLQLCFILHHLPAWSPQIRQNASLGLSQVFPEHASGSEHKLCPLSSLAKVVALLSPYSPKKFSLQSSLPCDFGLICHPLTQAGMSNVCL